MQRNPGLKPLPPVVNLRRHLPAVHHDIAEDIAEDVSPVGLARRRTMPLADLMNQRSCHHGHMSRCARFSSSFVKLPPHTDPVIQPYLIMNLQCANSVLFRCMIRSSTSLPRL